MCGMAMYVALCVSAVVWMEMAMLDGHAHGVSSESEPVNRCVRAGVSALLSVLLLNVAFTQQHSRNLGGR